ncbi:hypothetical protein [Phytohabitans suffuscus]|uniref:Uncharacterized protein n=1 Tax=Phytohabitans suffuscus TaxID=624315 RepID=A0A6F8YX21_9ACTN|nr:hypothetical protein [Phytohabitans suffuscus]BCB90488.1 hypothetical protein Psuf_078010 [Phytohabitans suffuscus]
MRRYLAQHAARAGQLDDLVADPLYLVAAAPDQLVAVLDEVRSDAAAPPARVYGQVAHRLAWEGYGTNAAILEPVAQAERQPDLAAALRQLDLRQPWTVPWGAADAEPPVPAGRAWPARSWTSPSPATPGR